jgi:hypothetical protein
MNGENLLYPVVIINKNIILCAHKLLSVLSSLVLYILCQYVVKALFTRYVVMWERTYTRRRRARDVRRATERATSADDARRQAWEEATASG